ncbi:MAG: hypothetical protein LBR08_05320 [Bacteroidales bacterium]|nr:hypothetical protein [Bacteroidales bacterium]
MLQKKSKKNLWVAGEAIPIAHPVLLHRCRDVVRRVSTLPRPQGQGLRLPSMKTTQGRVQAPPLPLPSPLTGHEPIFDEINSA